MPPPPPFQVRNVKLDFPRFNGSEVLQWIFKAEQFFDYYNTADAQRLTIAAIHMEKEVVPWFQMTNRSLPFQSWIDFTRVLELEFGPSPYECTRSQLFKLAQVGSVHDYYTKFTALANRVQGVTSDALMDCFVGGLKPEIQRDVIAQSPTTLICCVSLAKLFEEKYQPKHKPFHTSSPFRGQNSNPSLNTQPTSSQSLKSTTLPPLLTSPAPNSTFPKHGNIKRISPAEMQLRREKGLCYTCDEKFHPSHRCPNKQYLLLHMDDEDTVQLQIERDNVPDDVQQDHHLSYNALKGSFGLGTMKFQGTINGMVVQILLDSGNSDNFLQPRIANCLKLTVEPTLHFQVLVGNGNSLVAEGLVKHLDVMVQGHSLKLPVYLLPISGADLVLGAAWLATLGPHISHYSKLTLKFYKGNQFVTLHGDQQ